MTQCASRVVVVRLGRNPISSITSRNIHLSPALHHQMPKPDPKLVLKRTKNQVTTLTMNDPKKLNGWTGPMMVTLAERFKEVSSDPDTKVVVLTGSDPYYCAGVNLSATIQPMHPKKLHDMIFTSNRAVFDQFLDCPKPIIIGANGPAIGACVTSATLCDAIVASEQATFLTPFARLGVPPEGCSSVHFARIMGEANAERMLGKEGWKPIAHEAKEVGLIKEVVPHDRLLDRCQALGEEWVAAGKAREIPGGGSVEEYKEVNRKESLDLADAFLSTKFLEGQEQFLKSKGKSAMIFTILKHTRPLWSKLL